MIRPIKRYRPERHNMRGPDPKWLEKHGDGIVRLMPSWTATALTLLTNFLFQLARSWRDQLGWAALRHRRNKFGSTRQALLFAAMAGGPMTEGQRIGCREDPPYDVDRLRRGPLRHDFSIALPVGDIGPCGSFLFFG